MSTVLLETPYCPHCGSARVADRRRIKRQRWLRWAGPAGAAVFCTLPLITAPLAPFAAYLVHRVLQAMTDYECTHCQFGWNAAAGSTTRAA